MRTDHSMELPARHSVLENCTCPGMWQYHHCQTCPAHTALRTLTDQYFDGGWFTRGCDLRTSWARLYSRKRTGHRSAGSESIVYRIDRGWLTDHAPVRRQYY